MEPVKASSDADWIVEAVHPFAQDVGSIVPEGFDAYARVFFPAGKGEGDDEWQNVAWTAIATANGKVAHPEMQFASIVPATCFDDRLSWRRGQPGLWDWPPSDGELPEDLAVVLSELLSGHTSTPQHCYFAFWDGYGDPTPAMPPPRDESERMAQESVYLSYQTGEVFRGTPRASRDAAARFSTPGREYLMFEGHVSEACTEWDGTGGGNLPSIWWPHDRSWCVAGDTDLDSVYVGGSRNCIDDLVKSDALEALEISLSASIGVDALNSN